MKKQIKRILITGACGQIGTELTVALRKRFGDANVVAADRKTDPNPSLHKTGPFYLIDILNRESVETIIARHEIDTIVHLAAILSAVGEKNPALAWHVNVNGLINILEIARIREMTQVLVPSSIAVFGPETPRENTPNDTVLKPTTIYGITKVSGELLCDYFVTRHGLDVRGLRYPGIISAETLPGGGTTDYAVSIFYEAVKHKRYTCFVSEDTRLPMMYMPDCVKATMDLMTADSSRLKHRSNFNVGAMSFSVGELVEEIRKHIPDFECTYKPDFRQAIADSWPLSIDDSAAREEWGWKPEYDLASMTADMLRILQKRHAEEKL